MGKAEIMYMCDSPIEIFECIWVNIWCMLDWIWSQNCRNRWSGGGGSDGGGGGGSDIFC